MIIERGASVKTATLARLGADQTAAIRRGGYAMTLSLSIDRFEGERKDIAVLLADDGMAINFPKALLPKGARAGDVLTFQIERDTAATKRVADDTKRVQDDLKKRDPGGDIKL
jgi:hypothetical protein